MAQQWWQHRFGLPINPGLGSTQTLALSAAGTWLALSRVMPESKTLSSVRGPYISAVAGTQANRSLRCEIWSDAAGIPGAIIGTQAATVTNFGVSWPDFTGYAASLVAGTQYWMVFKNTAVAPTVDYPTLQWQTFSADAAVNGGCTYWGSAKVHTIDSGANWATSPVANVAGYRWDFSDGSSAGLPFNSIAGAANRVYGTREYGITFTVPASYGIMPILGGSFVWRKNNAPADDLVYKLYNGTTLLATSGAIPRASITTGATLNFSPGFWTPRQYLLPGRTYRLTAAMAAGGGDSSNYYYVYACGVDSAAVSLPCMPWGSGETYYNGSAWADTLTRNMGWAVILDTDREMLPRAARSIGGLITQRG